MSIRCKRKHLTMLLCIMVVPKIKETPPCFYLKTIEDILPSLVPPRWKLHYSTCTSTLNKNKEKTISVIKMKQHCQWNTMYVLLLLLLLWLLLLFFFFFNITVFHWTNTKHHQAISAKTPQGNPGFLTRWKWQNRSATQHLKHQSLGHVDGDHT